MVPSGIESIHSSAESDTSHSTDGNYRAWRSKSTHSLLRQTIAAFGMSPRRRREPNLELELDYFSASPVELADRLLKKKVPQRERRRIGQTFDSAVIQKTLLLLPVIALSVFGFLHILQVSIGSARLFWDLDEDNFLPNWGKHGNVGEGLTEYPTDATRDVMPINCHSHNDYTRRVPLFDAIHWGCTGVEADVWLFDKVHSYVTGHIEDWTAANLQQELFVGHSTASLTRKRTFHNLYVDPIVHLLDSMNQGTEFANATTNATRCGIFEADPDQTLVLLIDIKTSGIDTFPMVHEQLEVLREKDYLSYWDGENLHKRPVTVVGTGNTPFNLIVADKQRRDVFFDAPLDRLWEQPSTTDDSSISAQSQEAKLPGKPSQNQNSNQGSTGTGNATIDDFNPATSYYASVSFMHTVGLVWRGKLSSKQLNIIRGQIQGAQRRGLKTRYWDTPSWPINLRNYIWDVLMEEGADMLNVDDLKGAAVENWKIRTHRLW